MDAARKTRAARNPAGAGRQSEDARARSCRRSSAFPKPNSSPRIAATASLRIEPRVNDLLTGLEAVGEVMALTRNESAVHEKIGVYDKVVTGNAQRHGARREHRPAHLPEGLGAWLCGRKARRRRHPPQPAVLRRGRRGRAQGASARRRPISTPIRSWSPTLASADQRPTVRSSQAGRAMPRSPDAPPSVDDLRERWSRLTDVHQFFGMLKALKLSRQPGRAHGRPGLCLAARQRRASPPCSIMPPPATCRSCASSAIAAASRSIPARSSRSSRWGRGSTCSTRPSTCICGPTTSARSGRCASRPRTATSPRSKPMTPTAR